MNSLIASLEAEAADLEDQARELRRAARNARIEAEPIKVGMILVRQRTNERGQVRYVYPSIWGTDVQVRLFEKDGTLGLRDRCIRSYDMKSWKIEEDMK